MRRLLSIFFALSLLLTTAAGGAVGLSATCPPKACCCDTEEPCCPPAAVPQSSCGQGQSPAQTNCGQSQAPIQAAQLPQAPGEVESVQASGDAYARPWPSSLEQAKSIRPEAKEPRFTATDGGALERAPALLSKLRILRI